MKYLALVLVLIACSSFTKTASATCTVDNPQKGIFAYPALISEHATYQDYEFRVFDATSCDEPIFKQPSGLEILKDGKRLYTKIGWSFSIGYLSAEEAEEPPDAVMIPPGTDITGEGKPELLITEWSGGAHCCYTFHLFRLAPEFKKIQSIDVKDADGSHFIRLAGQKGLIFNTADFSDFEYFPSSFATTPAGEVFLAYHGGKFSFYDAYMRAAPPTSDELATCEARFKTNPAWKDDGEHLPQPERIWQYVTDLIYTGNESLAIEFLTKSWGGDKTSFNKFTAKYQQLLKTSIYYQQIIKIQKAKITTTSQKINWQSNCAEYQNT